MSLKSHPIPISSDDRSGLQGQSHRAQGEKMEAFDLGELHVLSRLSSPAKLQSYHRIQQDKRDSEPSLRRIIEELKESF